MGENYELVMRRPRIKEAPKQTPHHSSPATERILEDSKEKVRPKKAVDRKKK